MTNTVGERLRQHLAEHTSWTVTEFCAQLGVSYETFRKWQKGDTAPNRNRVEAIAKLLGKSPDWVMFGMDDSLTPPSEGVPALPYGADTHTLTDTSGNRLRRAGDIELPRLDVQASMGLGLHVPEHDEVVATMTVDRSWLRRSASFTALENLVLITGYGDSMKGTFEDGDILLVDRGVHEVKIDGVYVLALNDELYIKRLQRKPDGSVLMISDNDRYEPYLIQNGEKDRFAVKGRVVLAWNAKRL